MKEKVYVPAFTPVPVQESSTITTTIKRKDEVVEIEFPSFPRAAVMEVVEKLALRKRAAHDRPLDELIEIMEAARARWMDPNYDLRKEALEIIPVISGQSRKMCEKELDDILMLWQRPVIYALLEGDLGGAAYLEDWVPRGNFRLHAQPQGLVLHNLAGNSFNLGLSSLFNGLVTKNVNLMKLARESPYFAVKAAESLREVDKKLAREIGVMYWPGSQGEIFDAVFNSGLVDCVMAWGGLMSIEEIRRRANRFGIKVIDHGPKFSYTIISDDIFRDADVMRELAAKISRDVVWFNQKSCLSPRVIFIKEREVQTRLAPTRRASRGLGSETAARGTHSPLSRKPGAPESAPAMKFAGLDLGTGGGTREPGSRSRDPHCLDLKQMMRRSVKILKNEITDFSPRGFAELIAEQMEITEQELPRKHQTQAEVVKTIRKREYFEMHHVANENGEIFTPKDGSVNWTVVYLRNPPTMKEINMCENRFLIVTRIADIDSLLHYMRAQKLGRFLQTFGVHGPDEFIEQVAEEFSLLGAFRFPRAGEHNSHQMGTPWDGKFTLAELVRWVYIGFLDLAGNDGHPNFGAAEGRNGADRGTGNRNGNGNALPGR